jgi:hypothetical protein
MKLMCVALSWTRFSPWAKFQPGADPTRRPEVGVRIPSGRLLAAVGWKWGKE